MKTITTRAATTLAALAAMLLFTGAAAAAESASPAACLRKPTEPLKYPERAKELRESGKLRARLTFKQADSSPKVEILAWNGTPEMADAAQMWLYGYRLPCLPAGETVALEQEIVFTANASEESAQAGGEGRNVWACLRTPGPFNYNEEQQTGRLVKQKTGGALLLQLSFDAPDKPPKIKRLYNTGPGSFALAAESHALEYRLPCLQAADGVVETKQAYQFRSYARSRDLALKDMGIVDLLRAAKDVDKVHVKFDLGTMACPFKLRWRMYQPADRNDVFEIGAHVPQRRPLMEWLGTLSLDLGAEQAESLFGAESIITVPCGTIEL